jgi:probable HAF family extracellular repeat protein
MTASVSRRIVALQVGLVLALVAVASCREDRAVSPDGTVLPSFAKGGPPSSGLTVASTTPSSAPRNTTLNVTVSGSGFEQGSRAVWALNGDTTFATTKIKTNSTTFVSQSKLTANITINGDTPPDQYDVQVVTLSGRKGIGIELFTVTYDIIDLGAGDGSSATAVNDNNQIVGGGGTGVGAFLWENGVLRQLGTPPGITGFRAQDINNNGVVVGYGMNAQGTSQAIIWTAAGGAQVLAGSLGGTHTLASRINDQGLIVGEASIPGDAATHTVVWENGVMRDVQAFTSGSTFPWGLSNTGIVVGQWNPGGVSYSWTASGGMSVLAGLEGPNDIPIGVNDAGQVVGWYQKTTGPVNTAFLWDNGVITDLGTFGGASSVAFAINNSGQIVGRAELPTKRQTVPTYHAFLWSLGEMKDLGTFSDRPWAQANDINDVGTVVGETIPGKGMRRATLWRIK